MIGTGLRLTPAVKAAASTKPVSAKESQPRSLLWRAVPGLSGRRASRATTTGSGAAVGVLAAAGGSAGAGTGATGAGSAGRGRRGLASLRAAGGATGARSIAGRTGWACLEWPDERVGAVIAAARPAVSAVSATAGNGTCDGASSATGCASATGAAVDSATGATAGTSSGAAGSDGVGWGTAGAEVAGAAGSSAAGDGVSATGDGASATGGDGSGTSGGGSVTGAGASAGNSPSGSTYPSESAATRTPRWTCDCEVTASALAPTVPTTAPSSTTLPRSALVEPSCRSVTAYPSAVWIVTARPPLGTKPTNETVPAAGARTSAPTAAPMSTPRCWPAA